MLLLLISLFTHYDMLQCVNYERAKFDESLLMKQHHQNFLQIKDFIKKAQHKFHEERSVLRFDDYKLKSTRDDEFLDHSITNWWRDNTSSIDQLGLDTPQTFLLPLIRSRPTFPFSITPYTTELNNKHLKWDEIFPDQNIYTRSSASGLRTGLKVSSTPKNPSLPQPSLKTLMPKPKDQKSSSPTIKPSILHKCTKQLHPKPTLLPNNPKTGHSSQPFGPTTTLITPNEKLKKLWLAEISTYTPVERLFKALATQTRLTPSNDYTTNPALQYGRTLSNAQTLVPTKQLKIDSKDQTPLILHQGIALSETPTKVDGYVFLNSSTASAKTAQFFIKGLEGILHFRNETEKDEQKTKKTDDKSAKLASDVEMKVTPTTAGDMLVRELDPHTAAPTFRKSRRFHSKARKRNRHHNSYKRHKMSERHQNNRYRYPEYSNENIHRKQQEEVEYGMLRRTIKGQRRFSINTPKQRFKRTKNVIRPKEKKKHTEPTEPPNAMLEYEHGDTEDEFIKFIENMDESIRNTAQRNKTSFYHHVKESLKQAESKKRAKRLKLKAELLRKIVEGSSYSDEEASLTKNLMQALQYGNRTFEHDVARNNRDTMNRL